MWQGINNDQDTKSHMTWVAEGMTHNSLIWVTDGSYNRKKAQELSWMDYLLYQDRLETDRYLLEEVNLGKLVSCGNVRRGGRDLQGGQMGSHPLLRQQTCT